VVVELKLFSFKILEYSSYKSLARISAEDEHLLTFASDKLEQYKRRTPKRSASYFLLKL